MKAMKWTAAGLAGIGLASAAMGCKDESKPAEVVFYREEAPKIEEPALMVAEMPKTEAAPDAGVVAAPARTFDIIIGEARKKMDAQDFAGALESAREAVAMDAKSPEGHHLAGRALLSQGKLGAATKSLKKAAELEGASSHVFNNLGYAYLITNQPERAIEALEAGFERGPLTSRLLNNLGLAYEKMGRFAEAEDMFEGAIELRPGYVKAMVNLDRVTKQRIAMEKESGEKEEAPEVVPGG
jgi:Flp pilus assembly protein TadD